MITHAEPTHAANVHAALEAMDTEPAAPLTLAPRKTANLDLVRRLKALMRKHMPGSAGQWSHSTLARALAALITGQLEDADCRAVLLVGRTRKSNGFRVQLRAENRALDGGKKISQTGPALARATAPAAEMVRALIDAGLAADATSDSEEDTGSYLLYRVLAALPDNADAPSVGLLRIPASLNVDQLRLGVQTAAAAMARHLSPLPRARVN